MGIYRNPVILMTALLVFGLSAARVFAAEVITLRPLSIEDKRYNYADALLSKALARSASSAKLVHAKSTYSRDRLLQELIKGENIHVTAEAPKPGWEENLIPIRIPLRKGIQGYRLFLINAKDQPALEQVRSLEDLMEFPTGSGSQWSTRRVMEDAGFQVVTSEDYETLFQMLKLRRFITFGRGINEIFKEEESFKAGNQSLTIEKHLCLFIPLPTYFFVSPAHPELAESIEEGLNLMIADGSFDEHFLEHHRADIERARLSERKIFAVSNPNLSKSTPLSEPSYWFDPASFASKTKEKGS